LRSMSFAESSGVISRKGARRRKLKESDSASQLKAQKKRGRGRIEPSGARCRVLEETHPKAFKLLRKKVDEFLVTRRARNSCGSPCAKWPSPKAGGAQREKKARERWDTDEPSGAPGEGGDWPTCYRAEALPHKFYARNGLPFLTRTYKDYWKGGGKKAEGRKGTGFEKVGVSQHKRKATAKKKRQSEPQGKA